MKLTIDGRATTVMGPTTLLEAARAQGIFIPSLCDHPGLDPFAACRLCLVEVKGRKGYVPACSTSVEEGMDVTTSTPELQALRRGILELILAEHPHACLICAEKPSCEDFKSTIRKTGEVTGCVLCPANGRCELQKVVEALGLGLVPFPSHRRPGEVRRDDPFIDRDNSLCILCGRCVRVCQEVRGASVLTFISRGSATVIGAALDRRLIDTGCQFCGACVDVCPTGSLSERASRYDPPPENESRVVCPLCGQGCGLVVKSRAGHIQSAAPDPEGPANRGQACVRGRFLAKAAVHHPRRLLQPMIRINGALRQVPWDEALEAAATRLANAGAGEVAVEASADSSCEDLFALHRFAAETVRAAAVIGPWQDVASARLREAVRAGGAVPLDFKLADIGRAQTILVLGEDLPVAQPLVNLEVVRALRKGATVIFAGPAEEPCARSSAHDLAVPAGQGGLLIEALTAALLERKEPDSGRMPGFKALKKSFDGFEEPKALRALKMKAERLHEIAGRLTGPGPLAILVGAGYLKDAGPEGAAGLVNLALLSGGRLIALDRGANTRGALAIAAAFPARKPWTTPPRVLYVAGSMTGPRPAGTESVIIPTSYTNAHAEAADILLPEATAFEAAATLVNIEGRVQVSGAAVGPAGAARPGWSILSGLAERLGAPGPRYASADDVRADLFRDVPAFKGCSPYPGASGEVFLEGEAAGEASFLPAGTKQATRPKGKPAGKPLADVYKGLNLALENKSLKLVRER